MTASEAVRSVQGLPWRLWIRQVAAISRLDLRKNLFSKRGAWIYFLAFAPTVVIWLSMFVNHRWSVREATYAMAAIFQFYYLRLAIFFGTLGVFTRMLRGEMVERTLHYYLLAPVRREVLVVAKFCSGVLTATLLFCVAVFADFMFIHRSFSAPSADSIWNGPGLHQLAVYLGVTALACIGYGALFLAFSIMVKNPIVPGLVLLGWEALNPMLPPLLQKLSIIFYLRHLLPVEIPARGLSAVLAVMAEPVRPWVAVSGVICLTLVVLVYACWRVRQLEISYTTD